MPLAAGMVQVQAPVLVHRRIAPDHYWVRVKAPVVAKRSRPGQFLHVRCGAGDFPLLRRPFSLLDADPQTGTVDFIYKVVGFGTETLTRVSARTKLDLLGPLGRPFEIPIGLRSAILVGGGVGIPPMVLLAKQLLRRRRSVRVFLGARTGEWVICVEQFRKLGVPVRIATDDGSRGRKGSVVDLLKDFLERAAEKPVATGLYVCGPTPMMAAAAALARRRRLPVQVSLEERMGCAMGCCMGCVVEVATESSGAHARFQRVCTEGPVFPAEAVLWK